MRKCRFCGQEIIGRFKQKKYCNDTCYYEHYKITGRKKKIVEKKAEVIWICQECGNKNILDYDPLHDNKWLVEVCKKCNALRG